jgi:prepilin-type N-terminal cleavage/methylation domain-containing protein
MSGDPQMWRNKSLRGKPCEGGPGTPSTCNVSASSRREAFTLIELLVVVAIISLLVAMLVPSLQRARELAANTLCLNSHRTIVMGGVLYQSENDELIHPRSYKDTSTGKWRGWHYILEPYMEVGEAFWKCPSDDTIQVHTYKTNAERTYNPTRDGPGLEKASSIPSPEITFMYTDRIVNYPTVITVVYGDSNVSLYRSGDLVVYPPGVKGDIFDRPHSRDEMSSIWAFLDGHVATVEYPLNGQVKFAWWKDSD